MSNEICKYRNGDDCEFHVVFGVHLRNLDVWCDQQCRPTNYLTQIRRLGIPLPKPPENISLLDWAKQCAESGKIKRKQPDGCKGCGKLKNIIQGFGKLIAQEILGNEPEDWVIKRAEICVACDYRTFLSVAEWGTGFGEHVVKRLLHLQTRDLPINHKPERFDKLWCAKCKCCIEAKIRADAESCPEGKWAEVD